MLTDYRERTEASCPYTIMQVEDVMFIDQKKAISLEYIFYQKDGNYVSLEQKVNDGQKIQDYEADPLRTSKYDAKDHKESIYKKKPIDYVEKKDEQGKQVDYLKDLTDEQLEAPKPDARRETKIGGKVKNEV